MVSTLSIICMVITLLLSLILPIGVFLWYGMHHDKSEIWLAGFLGACGFAILQLGIRLPLLNKIAALPEFAGWVEEHYIIYCLLLAFTAGLFEVVGRYGVAKIVDKAKKRSKELTFETGFMAGIGHGGIEAAALVGLTYVNNLIYSAMVNMGLWESMMEEIQAAGDHSIYEVYASVPDLLIETPWYLYLASGYERILTMIAHIAMTLIVFYFVSRKKDVIGILISLCFHTAIDFFVPLLNGFASEYLGNRITQNTAYVLMYILLTIIAVIAIVVIMKLKKSWKQADERAVCKG